MHRSWGCARSTVAVARQCGDVKLGWTRVASSGGNGGGISQWRRLSSASVSRDETAGLVVWRRELVEAYGGQGAKRRRTSCRCRSRVFLHPGRELPMKRWKTQQQHRQLTTTITTTTGESRRTRGKEEWNQAGECRRQKVKRKTRVAVMVVRAEKAVIVAKAIKETDGIRDALTYDEPRIYRRRQ